MRIILCGQMHLEYLRIKRRTMKRKFIFTIWIIFILFSGCDYYPLSRGDEVYIIQRIEDENKDDKKSDDELKTPEADKSEDNMPEKNEDENDGAETDEEKKPVRDEADDKQKTDDAKDNENSDEDLDKKSDKDSDEKPENVKNEEDKNPDNQSDDKTEDNVEKNKDDDNPVEDKEDPKPEKEDDDKGTENETKEDDSDKNPSEFGKDPEVVVPIDVSERKWNILVYMAADNNLESAAIEDLCEMELSELNTDLVSVFVLMDRNEAYDTSNGNWTGTRLLKLKTGKKTESKFIQSEEIECKDLGLTVGQDLEIDMSSPYVLTDTISYLHKRYPAENYGLIMWGHGTGWRNDSNVENTSLTIEGGYKGFAFDETSHTYMTLKQFGNALRDGLKNNKFGFIGFDTCFASELEVMYEIKDCTDYAVGSEGLVMNSGWNYKSFFNEIQKDSEKTSLSICMALSNKFKNWYETAAGASFSVIDMKNMGAYFEYFDKYMETASELITDRKTRDDIIGVLYTNPSETAEKYTYGTQNNDVYLDVCSVIKVIDNYFAADEQLHKCSTVFELVEKSVVIDSWNSIGTKGGLGVYFHTLGAGSVFSTSHPSSYIKGKTTDQIAFVNDSLGYVPGVNSEKSLLEKLFYEAYE